MNNSEKELYDRLYRAYPDSWTLNFFNSLLNHNKLWIIKFKTADDYYMEFVEGWLGWSPGNFKEVRAYFDMVIKQNKLSMLDKMLLIKIWHTKIMPHVPSGR